ncbi:CotH kinase family protein [Dyadobacter subterraneus]|uniref:CotH kinase family protein n=1 Tax=Dyadobacter subterraneus TaxID=2773304 RepID=A0ABR9WB92_9BACT|nr:CotH kinase family protein [Dyadobacter subterraneus]MBE9462414.1 CotH kinase family protein [Dyadobacter subterraneus]
MTKNLAILLTCLLFSLLHKTAIAKEVLFVNEIVASNNTGITDATGAHEDWFEIYNPTDHVIDIAGYFLSDKPGTPNKYQMPTGSALTKIPSKGFIVIWASGVPSRGALHVSFSLSKDGEDVVISSPELELIDDVTFGAIGDDVSYGRSPDGATSLVNYSTPSPGKSNATGTTQLPTLAPPVFSASSGFKGSAFLLTITHPEPGVTIRYTLDGSDPQNNNNLNFWAYKNKYNENGTAAQEQQAQGLGQGLSTDGYSSTVYQNPISITDRSTAENKVSLKNTTFTVNPQVPSSKIYKGTVVRVKVFKSGFNPSETVTKTYFINNGGVSKYPVPVLSLATTETSLFEYNTGIYTPGITFDKFRAANPTTPAEVCTFANFSWAGDDWQRDGNIEYFDNNNPVLNQQIGFRLHGGCTRSLRQKTLRLYSDTEFNYSIFPENPTLYPKRILLRNSGNDTPLTMLRDSYFQNLVRHLPFDTQLSRPSILFINSEYWGIHNITERYDKFYLKKKYGVDEDEVDIISVEGSEVEEGDITKYNEFLNFVNNNSLADAANYNTLKTIIDLENYTDYQISEIYSANGDWPFKNMRLWRYKTAGSNPTASFYEDGRWRWMLYDTDLGLTNPGSNSLLGASNAPAAGPMAIVLKKLLQNPDYKIYFTNRLADLLNTTFLPSRASALLDQIKAQYTPLMPDHIARWGAPGDMNNWNQNVDVIKTFVSQRPPSFRDHVRTLYGAALANFNLTVDVSDAAQGYVKINTLDIVPETVGVPATPYPWTGIYFQTIPVKLTAVAKSGFHFVRWEDKNGVSTTDPVLTVTSATAALNYKAFFSAGPLPVVLKSFNAKKDQSQVKISWETTSETNNDYFEIERSADVKSWTSIGRIKGFSSSTARQAYKLTDEQPLPNISYYRLKQVDLDGTLTYSRAVSVDMGTLNLTNFWPNPVSETLNIALDQAIPWTKYAITDINGTIVKSEQKVMTTNAIQIPVSKLNRGMYIIQLTNDEGRTESVRFLKQ